MERSISCNFKNLLSPPQIQKHILPAIVESSWRPLPFFVEMQCYGYKYLPVAQGGEHAQGTEIKAITKHNLVTRTAAGGANEIYVLVDIWLVDVLVGCDDGG